MNSEIRNGTYAGYKGQDYRAEKDFVTGQISIASRNPQDVELNGFHQIANRLYKKVVSLNELDYLYSITTFAHYKGVKFQVVSVQDGEVLLLHGGSPKAIKDLDFTFVEPLTYEKLVGIDEIENIFEEKTPIWGFQGSK